MLGESQEDRDVLAVVARSAAELAVAANVGVESQFATITSYGDAGDGAATCTVHFDGDPADVQHEVVSALSGAPAAGDRVLVLFLPPHGAVAIAALPTGTTTTGGTGFAFKVAASDASDESKAAAHFVCDGTRDDWIINDAFYRLFQANLSGRVELSEGTFYCAGGSPQDTVGYIALGPGSSLVGRGVGATRITWADNAQSFSSPLVQMGYGSDLYSNSGAFPGFNIGLLEYTGDFQRIAHVMLDTRFPPAAADAAIWTDAANARSPQVIEDCVIVGDRGRIQSSNPGAVTIRRCVFDGAGTQWWGPIVRASVQDAHTWVVEDCSFHNITGDGTNDAVVDIVQSDGVILRRCEFRTIGDADAVAIRLAEHVIVDGCTFTAITGSGYTSTANAVYVTAGDTFMVRDCWGESGAGAGVYVTSPGEGSGYQGVIKDNRFQSFDYGVRIVSADETWVDSNDLRNCTTAGLSDSGTGTVTTDNQT